MSTTYFSDRTVTLDHLDRARRAARRGSNDEAIAERAIDYALNATRTDLSSAFGKRAVMRNAAFAHYRSAKSRAEAMKRLRAEEGAPVTGVHADRPSAKTLNRTLCASARSAEDVYLSTQSDFCECTLQIAGSISTAAVTFVRRLMDGDSVADAAKEAGMSRASGYRLVESLRDKMSQKPIRSVVAA